MIEVPMRWWKRRTLNQKLMILGLAISFIAAIGAFSPLFIDSASDTEPTSSPYAEIAQLLINETRDTLIWTDGPIIFPESVKYLNDNFEPLNPFNPHPLILRSPKPGVINYLSELPDNPTRVTVPELVMNTKQYAGKAVAFEGNVVSTSRHSFVEDDVTILTVQVFDSKLRGRAIAYCRFAVPKSITFKWGKRVAVVGVVLAAGDVPEVNGGTVGAVYVFAVGARSLA
jgi:hypothetical protein